jgi:hypothetical protein
MSKPLLISDCDEVLLHMIVPFRDWLDEAHHIHFDLVHGDWGEALRHKHDGTVVERGRVWDLLNGFFDTEMSRQQAIDGAVDAINRLRDVADVVILTNLLDHRAEPRAAQLKAVGIDAPVYTNQGGKGEALGRILEEYKPSVAVFVDDLGHQHDSVGEHFPDVWRLHFVGEPLLWERVKSSKAAHARLDRWADAEHWIRQRLVTELPAPALERITS